MKWVTRSGVRMDRAAMVWLIKKMVDPEAEIVILPESEVLEYAEETGATPFHHPKAELRNTGVRTGFDAVRTHYELQDPALGLLALIIRGADSAIFTAEKALRDGGDKVPADVKSEVEGKIASVRSALEGRNVDMTAICSVPWPGWTPVIWPSDSKPC